MKDLFSDDPAFKQKKRDSRGRFATPEKAMYDKAIRERSYMEFLVEKYKRMAESTNGAFIALQKVADNQRRIIADLRKELARINKITHHVRPRISKRRCLRGTSASA